MDVRIENHGPLITATNYWESDLARDKKILCSLNAGAVRILLPPVYRPAINDMRAADEVILSRGPWPAMGVAEAVEILFDDCTAEPYVLHLNAASFDALPGEPPAGREWIITVWDQKKGRPHKCLERPLHWRRVPEIPWMRPWREKT